MAKAKKASKSKARAKAAARSASASRRPVKKAKAKSAPKRKMEAKAKRPPKQEFVVNHLKDGAFEGGLRSYAEYRELGIAPATHGLVQAHVIRLLPPCDPAVVSKEHYHAVDFQMIYVLKGWMKGEYEGQGVIMMREGSCWTQPPGIKHTVLDYSADCELLEIIMPAEFDTVET
jgi:mannose-6-phosphate isomerase-like protein (cupin superfamily)